MNLKELGEHFRIERERQGLSVEDVVMRTKISKANVRALEDGDASLLPHPVYAKGFVRNYALLLGLDPDECAEVIGREYVAEDNVSAPQPALDGPEQAIGGDGRKSGLLVFLAGLLGILLVGGGLYYWNSLHGEAEKGAEVRVQEPEAAPAVPAQAEPQAEPQGEPQAAPQGAAQGAEDAEAAPAPANGEQGALEPAAGQEAQAAQAGQESAAGDEEVRPAPEQDAAPAGNAAALAGDGRQKVLVTASEACWIFAKVDGGDEAGDGAIVDVVLQPGQSKLVRFHREMVMKLGNAGGVRVTLNGKDYPFEAQSGQVRTLTFSAP